MKKAIKKLKKQVNVEMFKVKNNINYLTHDIMSEINKVDKRVSNINIQKLQSELQTIAKHVQDLEAEKEKNCSCKEKTSIIDPDRPKEVTTMIDLRQATADAIVKSLADWIKANPDEFKSGLVERKRETIQFNGEPLEVTQRQKHVLINRFTLYNTNTQKTDKNATEGKQEGKKEQSKLTWLDESSELTQEMFEALKLKARSQAHYETELKKAYDNCFICYDKTGNVIDKPETIITNEMFNEELERFLSEEKNAYPIDKYTSTDNSIKYIGSLIYGLYTVTGIPDIPNLIRSKLKSKGEHYNKESDRYANIKDALKRNKEEQPHLFANWTVVDKINSYKDKHVQWLIDTKGTVQTNDDLQEAYIDVICYCIMCYIYLKFNGESKNG